MAQRGTDLGSVKVKSHGDKPKITDKVNLFKFPEGVWVTLRLHGGTFSYVEYWCRTNTEAVKKGARVPRFPITSPSYDPETQQYDSTKFDPWKAYADTEYDANDKEKVRMIDVRKRFYMEAIYRKAQRDIPRNPPKPTTKERKTGFKDKDSDTYMINVALSLSPSLTQKIKELSGLNVVDGRSGSKAFPVSHPKYGRDIKILYDSKKEPANQYAVQLGDKRTPLTEEELSAPHWDLSDLLTPAEEKETRADFEGWSKRMGIKTAKKRKHDVEELDEELEEDDDLDDEDDDTPKSKKKKPAAKKTTKRKSSRDDDDEDEEDDEEDDDLDEDEDEDDEPPRRSSKKKPVAKGKKKVVDEDDEDDEDEEDDDLDDEDEDEDEDDEPPKRSKKKAPVKSKAKSKRRSDDDDEDDEEDDEEEDDLDDDDEDEEEDESPKSKKKPAAKKAPAKKTSKRKPVDDDEDDEDEEDDDLDDEDDEEDEPPKRASKKKPAAKKTAAKRRASKDDDDEDEEDDEEEDDDLDDDDEEEEAPKSKRKAPAKKRR